MESIEYSVLDKGYVRLVRHWGDDEAVIEAARFCYGSESTPNADQRLLKRLLRMGHKTPFEFAGMVFEIKCPLFVRDQIVRHRMASYAVRSLRRTILDGDFYIPQFRFPPQETLYISRMCNEVAAYQDMIDGGLPPEQARGVLGSAFYTYMLMQMNASSLMNYLTQRLDKHAQWEHRQYAEAMFSAWKAVMPLVSGAWEEVCLNKTQSQGE